MISKIISYKKNLESRSKFKTHKATVDAICLKKPKMFANFALSSVLFVSVMCRLPNYPPPELLELVQPLHVTCTKKMGVTDDEVKNYDISDNSKKMMCYMKCLLVESNLAKEDESVIHYEDIIEYVPEVMKEVVITALDKCKFIEAGDDCVKSYNFNVCLSKADPDHYFLP